MLGRALWPLGLLSQRLPLPLSASRWGTSALRALTTTSRKDLPFRYRRCPSRFNGEIRASRVVLVYPPEMSDKKNGQVDLDFALREAKTANLDLVEVATNGPIPVCRLLDYRQFAMQEGDRKRPEEKKEHKEVKIGSSISANDLETKVSTIRRLLQDRHPVHILVEGKLPMPNREVERYRRFLDTSEREMLRENRVKGRKGLVVDKSTLPLPEDLQAVRRALDECSAACQDICTRVQDALADTMTKRALVSASDLKYTMELYPPSEGKEKSKEKAAARPVPSEASPTEVSPPVASAEAPAASSKEPSPAEAAIRPTPIEKAASIPSASPPPASPSPSPSPPASSVPKVEPSAIRGRRLSESFSPRGSSASPPSSAERPPSERRIHRSSEGGEEEEEEKAGSIDPKPKKTSASMIGKPSKASRVGVVSDDPLGEKDILTAPGESLHAPPASVPSRRPRESASRDAHPHSGKGGSSHDHRSGSFVSSPRAHRGDQSVSKERRESGGDFHPKERRESGGDYHPKERRESGGDFHPKERRESGRGGERSSGEEAPRARSSPSSPSGESAKPRRPREEPGPASKKERSHGQRSGSPRR